jgi:hypothetical protein
MFEGRGLGNKKINRINISVSNETLNKVTRLATSCNMKNTSLVGLIIERALNNLSYVDELQREFNVQPSYRVTPIKNGEKVIFALKEGAFV